MGWGVGQGGMGEGVEQKNKRRFVDADLLNQIQNVRSICQHCIANTLATKNLEESTSSLLNRECVKIATTWELWLANLSKCKVT